MADSNARIARRAAPVGTVAGMLPEMLEDAHLVPLPRPPPNSCFRHSTPPRGRTLTAAYDRKGHAPGSAPGAGPPPSAAGRRKLCQGEDSRPHPTSSPFSTSAVTAATTRLRRTASRGSARSARCDECGATVPAADARRPSSGRTLCRECAERLCYTCRECGGLHERSSTDFLVDAYGRTICSSCWDDWDACSECGEYFPADDLEEGEDADERLCRRCAARERHRQGPQGRRAPRAGEPVCAPGGAVRRHGGDARDEGRRGARRRGARGGGL